MGFNLIFSTSEKNKQVFCAEKVYITFFKSLCLAWRNGGMKVLHAGDVGLVPSTEYSPENCQNDLQT